jgi:hypothetical protein
MKLHEEFRLWENMWDSTEEQLGEDTQEEPSKKKYAKTINRPSIEQYFKDITSTKQAVIDFITTEFKGYKTKIPSIIYNMVLSKRTQAGDASIIQYDDAHNYRAFIKSIAKHGLNAKDIRNLCSVGAPLPNATDIFTEKTSSAEAVQNFMLQLGKEYRDYITANPRQIYNFAYTKWFTTYTNATSTGWSKGLYNLNPETVSWDRFVKVCNEKFNYTVRNLTAFFRAGANNTDITTSDLRVFPKIVSPSDYFNIITSSAEEATKFITEVWAPYVLAKSRFELASPYCVAMAKVTSGNHVEIGKNSQYNYKAFTDKVAAEFGITKQDITTLIKQLA